MGGQVMKKNDATSAPENDGRSFRHGHGLVGFDNLVVRSNPKSDRFHVKNFHHVEFWCSDATNAARRFSIALGMPIVAKSDLSTGNLSHASYLLRSGDFSLLFTAPYSPTISSPATAASPSIPTFDYTACRSFTNSHGLAVRSIAIEVDNAETAFSTSLANGAKPSSPPISLSGGAAVLAEIHLYGDVVLRYISYTDPAASSQSQSYAFLPGFEPITISYRPPHSQDFGIRRIDHVAGNVSDLVPAVNYLMGFTGFHAFSEFKREDLGKSSESGLNSVVVGNNDEMVLLGISEPVYGTKRRSQIETFLEHNEGAGVQHLGLMSEDIFRTLRAMRMVGGSGGGFEFMPSPPPTYYRKLKDRIGDSLSDEQIKECEELGILVDSDDQGTLLQKFTTPVGDRPTIFIEIIQRIGCIVKDHNDNSYQKGGCGGFGKGNVKALFKSVEEYEKTLEVECHTSESVTI